MLHQTTAIQVGTVSHGTLRTEDLIPVFLDLLREIDPDCAKMIINEYDVKHSGHEMVNDLIDILNEYAPDYCYFGSHEGDGSDFGFWPDMDLIEDAIHDGELFTDRNKGLPAIEVNDHGNMTLINDYNKVEWSIV